MKLGEGEAALQDVQMAINAGYPEENRFKLFNIIAYEMLMMVMMTIILTILYILYKAKNSLWNLDKNSEKMDGTKIQKITQKVEKM